MKICTILAWVAQKTELKLQTLMCYYFIGGFTISEMGVNRKRNEVEKGKEPTEGVRS
jgi:hypothetical protein